jgi:formyl-CoA transferase
VTPRLGPLCGIRVLDIGHFVAGPVAATFLGDFGADVIKVERPIAGDDMRRLGWMKDGASLWWSVEARNKRSITLNLRTEKGQQLLLRLVDKADVLVENFQPSVLEGWGLGWEILHRRNPRLVLLRTSGFGQSGPYKNRPAFNTSIESMGGLRYLMGDPDGPPARPGIALGDYAGAMLGAFGVLLALHERDAPGGSGLGQWIDNALYEDAMRLTEYTIPAYQHLGRIRERVGAGSAGTVPARAFRSSDRRWIGLAAASDRVFLRLCQAMGQPELADDPRFATNDRRIAHAAELNSIIERWTGEHDTAALMEKFEAFQVPAFPVYSAADILDDPHVRERDAVVDVPDPIFGHTMMPGVVPRLSRTPGQIRAAGPILGNDNACVYVDDLGLTQGELDALVAEGVI